MRSCVFGWNWVLSANMAMPRKPALGFIFVTLALDIIGIGLIIPILPKLVENFQGGDVVAASHTFGWLAALYSLMQFIFAPLLGSLSDRFGRRPVILASLLGSGLDYFLLAFAPNLTWFFVGRIIAGVTGANYAAATAYIADVSPPEKRAANFGLIGAAFGLGFIVGPAMGGVLGDLGLHVPFLAAGGLTLLNWLYGWFVLPESLARENRRAFSWAKSNPIGLLADLRRQPTVFRLAGSHFLIYFAHQVFPSIWVLYTSHRYGWNATQTGLSLALTGLTFAIVQAGLTPHIVRHLGEKWSLAIGLTISIAAYTAYGLAPQGWMIYPIIVFGSLGVIAGPALQAIVSKEVGPDQQGEVQGALTSLTGLAGIMGPPAATALFAYFVNPAVEPHMPGAAFFFSGLLTAGALYITIRSFRAHHAPEPMPAVTEADPA